MAQRTKPVQVDTVDYVARANQYARDVVSGKIPNCKWAILAAKRHLNDLKKYGMYTPGEDAKAPKGEFYFDPVDAAKPCAFGELLPHVKGRWAKKRELIKLQPWQCFILCCLFGWKRTKTDLRRFTKAYLEIPRKNGKSVLAAIIGLYMLSMDGEHGAEVYSGATTEKQAWEVFRPARDMFKSEEAAELREFCNGEVWAKSLNTADGSRFEPMIGDPGDGASPSCSIHDELHEHDTPNQIETMETGMGAREQPLLLMITTAGTNLAGPCYDVRSDACKVLDGALDIPEFFALIYTIDVPETEGDEGDDWTDPKVLIKANPNFDVSVGGDFLLAQQRQAKMNPAKQTMFKTKHLNVWCSARFAWMPMTLYQLCGDSKLKIDQFHGKTAVFILDLASKDDIAAFGQLFWEDRTEKVDGEGKTVRHYTFFCRYYIPEDKLHDEENPNAAHYRKWHEQGWLEVTPGAEIDFDIIKQDVLDLRGVVQCQELIYDPWRATQLAQQLRKEGAETVELRQNTQNLSPPMKEVLSAVRGMRWHHDFNPVTTWMFSNVTAKTDSRDTIYPNKEKPHLKIDGAVAAIMGMARCMLDPDEGTIDDWIRGGPVVSVAKPLVKAGGR